MSSFFRKLVLVLTMVGLPLQAVQAAIMPLCAQAKKISAGLEAQTSSADLTPISSSACSQHSESDEQHVNGHGTADDIAFVLSCDGVVCHISGGALPPAAAALNLADGFSYAASFNSSFTSSILPQPQRPPLI
ncbi:hypothetical protein [Nitrosovibrio tenuis]|nr:hypothetical protein [Nitrosovibrio tenuis]